MLTSDLDFAFPQELIARTPSRPTRVAFVNGDAPPAELTVPELLSKFESGDLLVLNESKVIPARVFSADEVEVLFLRSLENNQWQVLFPARDMKVGQTLTMPGGVTLTLKQKGLPQTVETSHSIDFTYFEKHGEVALPPYIQEARGARHNIIEDQQWYQSAWAKEEGSVAAPTASLHFSAQDIASLEAKGVHVAKVTLHVGAGTFLPVKSNALTDHVMHEEIASISKEALKVIDRCVLENRRVWALGTTVARTLESYAHGLLKKQDDGSYAGPTKLFIYPPFEFKIVSALLTNFHQPKSTLLALVSAFAGLERTKNIYAWAIDRRFHLFSYGDLSAWIKP